MKSVKTNIFLFALICSLTTANHAKGQTINAVTIDDIVTKTSSQDTVYIINFWATWCAPCVQELPEFNAMFERYKDKPVRILLISLDFKEDYPAKLQSFVSRKRLAPEVNWLSETDPNIFVPKVDKSWGGSIPATLIISPGKNKKFIEGQVTYSQVNKIMNDFLSE